MENTEATYYDHRFSTSTLVAVLFTLIAQFQMGIRFLLVKLTSRGLFYDAGVKWRPIAHELANGKILYLTTTYDNKTPVWHALNYLVALTDSYVPVFFVLVGLANAGVAFLLWYWLSTNGYSKGGIIAGVLYLAAVPLINGHVINVRSFSMLFLLLGILTNVAWKRGIYAAIAILFSQFTVFALPVLLYDGYRRSRDRLAWAAVFSASGLLTGAAVFALTAVVFSPHAAVEGIKASFLSGGEYVAAHPDHHNPFLYPMKYARSIAIRTRKLLFVIVPFVGAVCYGATTKRSYDVFWLAVLFAGSLLLTLGLKSLPYYWIPPVTFMSAVSGIGIERWILGESSVRPR